MATTIYTPTMLRGAGTRGVPEIPGGGGTSFSKYSLAFDGVDDYMSARGSGYPWWPYLTDAGACTMSFWIKSGVGVSGMRILEKNLQFYIIQSGTSTSIKYNIFTDTGYSVTGGAILDNEWHHCAMVYNGTTLEVFEDGVSVGSTSVTGTIPSSANYIYFGTYSGASHWLVGNLDDVAVFDSAKAIGDLWDGSGKPTDLSAESGLVGYWLMGDGATFPTIPDDSPNSAPGTMIDMGAGDIVTDVP